MSDEIKLWAVDDGDKVTELLSKDRFSTERDFEDLLVAKPELLEPGLTLVGRQTRTKGGPLDLLGVDSNGRLVVYELKRGTLKREAVTQALDYGSALNAMDLDQLQEEIQEQSRTAGTGIEPIEDFGRWYTEEHQAWSDESSAGQVDLAHLLPPRLVLVGIGVDRDTERIVRFVASDRVDLSVVSLHAFEHDGQMLFARHLEVDSETLISGSAKSTTAPGKRKILSSLLKRHGLDHVFVEIDQGLKAWLPDGRKSRVQNENGARFNVLTGIGPSGERKWSAGFVISVGDPKPPSLFLRICSWPLKQAPQRELEKLRDKVDLQTTSHDAEFFAVKDLEHWREVQDTVSAFVRAATQREAR